MTNIQKLTIARILYAEGYFLLARRFKLIDSFEDLNNIIHFMYRSAEHRKDDRLYKLIYPIVTFITGWSFNPYIFLPNE